ncbi:MAG TPA: WbqC family protein, partial [Chitinophagaceae bacterium]|nr:WbqC family protein [Chitinophagaceae bacterium]
MTVAIMQPYFFPYIGQFQLIANTDSFILCDEVQYIRHGWINRNRILSANKDHQYIIVPVKRHCTRATVGEIEITDDASWKTTIIRQLDYYRKKAPFFQEVMKLISDCLCPHETSIVQLNARCMKAVCSYIGLKADIQITSDLKLDYSRVVETSDWALQICQQLGASTYYNPPGGMAIYKKEHFKEQGIDLKFLQPLLSEYPQCNGSFHPGLSVIDIM